MEGFHKVIFHNFQERKSHQIRLEHPPNRIFKFQSDMEEVNLNGPDCVFKLQSDSENVNLKDHPEETRGLAKFLLRFAGFSTYLLLSVPLFGVLLRCCSHA